MVEGEVGALIELPGRRRVARKRREPRGKEGSVRRDGRAFLSLEYSNLVWAVELTSRPTGLQWRQLRVVPHLEGVLFRRKAPSAETHSIAKTEALSRDNSVSTN